VIGPTGALAFLFGLAALLARHGARPVLLAVTIAVVAGGYLVTRPDTSTVFFATDATIVLDAPVDSPPPDVPPDSPPSTDWTLVTIASAAGISLNGSDGVDTAIIGGDLCVVSAWEQSSKVTVSCLDGTWSTTILPGTVSAAEDAKFCDITGDGTADDVVASGQGRRISWWEGPSWSAAIPINAATNVNKWIQVECTTGRLWAGGRDTAATVGYFDIPVDPTDSGAWTWTPIGPVGWTMSLIPYDMDGDTDLDLVISDRTNNQPTSDLGSRWLVNDGSPTWTSNRIHKHISEGSPKFMHVISATSVIDVSSSSTQNRSAFRDWNGTAWITTTITQPEGVGNVHDVEPCEINGDAHTDLVFTYSTALNEDLGVAALLGPGYTELVDIDQAAGEKYDNVLCIDIDGDGDNDVLTSEQNVGLGVIYFENPTVP
jgi:hypothetical protein